MVHREVPDAPVEEGKESDWQRRGARSIGAGIAAGAVVGVVLGVTLADLAAGIAIGIAAGSSVGAGFYLRRAPAADEIPTPPLTREERTRDPTSSPDDP